MPPKAKSPKIVVRLNMSFKNPPDDYFDLVSDNYLIGNNEPLSLGALICRTAKHIVDFYMHCMRDIPSSEIQSQIDAAARQLGLLKVHEKEAESR